MTTIASKPRGAISYVEWLQTQIAYRLAGVWADCGPDIYDSPTFLEWIGLHHRPNAALERQLELRLRELERQARLEPELEAEL
jgi:hypothetical protein